MVRMPAEVEHLFASLYADFHKVERQRAEAESAEHPERYRDSLMMATGKNTNYSYSPMAGTPKGKWVRFCHTHHRNLAGYFLTFTEVWNGKDGYRTNFHGTKSKREAMDYCRERQADAAKPPAERKYTIPPWHKKR